MLKQDMTISRPCRHSLNVPVMFWTTIFLILLARGVYSSGEHSRFRRSPKFEQGTDVQGGFVAPNVRVENQTKYTCKQKKCSNGANYNKGDLIDIFGLRRRQNKQDFVFQEVRNFRKIEETYRMMQFFRELLQRQRAIQEQLQVYNGDDLRDNHVDWRKIPLPLLTQIRSVINDGSKEEEKRGSHMSLCHFKICNMG